MWRNFFIQLIAALFIILWIYTGYNKLFEYEEFKNQLSRSPFIGGFYSLISILLPVGEIILAILLVIKRTRLLGMYLSFITMVLFTGYIWLMLNFASDLPCSCGGVLSSMSWNDHLIFNFGYTLLGLIGILLHGKFSFLKANRKTLVASRK